MDCGDIHYNDIIKKIIQLLEKIPIVEKVINIVGNSSFYRFLSGEYSLTIFYIIFIVLIGSFQLICKHKAKWKLPKVIIIGTHGIVLILIILEIINDFSKFGFVSSFQNSNSSETFGNFFMLFHTIKNIVEFIKEKKAKCTCFEEDDDEEKEGIKLLTTSEAQHEKNYIIEINSRNRNKYVPLRNN